MRMAKITEKKFIVGIDEVGRGPLAGPVTVCAFAARADASNVRKLKRFLSRDGKGGYKDSKRLTEEQRTECFKLIKKAKNERELDIDFAVCHTSERIIDKSGIVFAIDSALRKSLKRLGLKPNVAKIFLDGGLKAPEEFRNQQTIIKGDQKVGVIALASIVAKVTRDRKMTRLADEFKGYGFEQNKGYGTAAHYRAINNIGLCEIHRRSFL